jgi:hypothetical protein
MKTLTITLTDADTRFILEALRDMHEKWLTINRTTTNEDEQADYGMDAIVLDMTREKLQQDAVKAFGLNITNFSREPIATASSPAPNGDHQPQRPR